MRVIAGTARSMPLKTIRGMDTRPTTDKIKETLFNILQTDVCGCRFLDLFSGSGAIAIEALSRGAAHAVLVEQNGKAAECIRENLIFTRTADRAEVYRCDVLTALRRLEGQKPFDIIFMDIQMPVMDGYTAAKAIRSSGREDSASIPIVAMTANAFSEDVQKAIHTGMNDHVAKPIDIKHLAKVLAKWLA